MIGVGVAAWRVCKRNRRNRRNRRDCQIARFRRVLGLASHLRTTSATSDTCPTSNRSQRRFRDLHRRARATTRATLQVVVWPGLRGTEGTNILTLKDLRFDIILYYRNLEGVARPSSTSSTSARHRVRRRYHLSPRRGSTYADLDHCPGDGCRVRWRGRIYLVYGLASEYKFG